MILLLATLAGALFTVLVCWALGKLLLRVWDLPLFREEEHLFAFLTGASLLHLLVFLLSSALLLRRGVLVGVGLAILVAAFLRGVWKPRGDRLPHLTRPWNWVFAACLLFFTALYLPNALAPEISADGATYHLGLVSQYLREHGFLKATHSMYAFLSQGIEMLFLPAFAIGRHSAASLVHFAFLLVLPLLLLSYGKRMGQPGAGAFAGIFLFVSPIVGLDGTSAMNDVAVACVLFGVFYLCEIWSETGHHRLLIPIGLLAGFGYALKYTAFLAVPYVLVRVYLTLRRKSQPWFPPLVLVSLLAAVMILPWMAKNFIWLGNPVSPFFNQWFPNPYVTPAFEADYVKAMRNYRLAGWWQIPWEAAVRGEKLTGLLGPLFLLLPAGLLAVRSSLGRRVLLAGAVFLFPYFSNIGTRFLIPALPFLVFALALLLSRWPRVAAGVALVHALSCWPSVVPAYCDPYAWRLTEAPWKAALRIEPEDKYLREHLDSYPIARLVEEQVPAGRPVLTLGGVADAYTRRQILVGYQSAANFTMLDLLTVPLSGALNPTWRHQFDFPARPLRRVRVEQMGKAPDQRWSVAEMRAYQGERELPRSGVWRLRASPNPWDVQLAFDNAPVTRWISSTYLKPGMYLEIDFGEPAPVSRVTLDCARDQPGIRLRLLGEDATGGWAEIAPAAVTVDIPEWPALRRAGTAELIDRGIGYLVIGRGDYPAEDMQRHEARWGLRLLGEAGGKRLYKIE